MKDQFGRRIDYLRISVTDKCNLRCTYCMPVEGLPWIPREDLLSYEEIAEVVGQMAGMGLRRIRLTGGEPLVRRDLPELVRHLRAVEKIEDISLSTNAVLLEGVADELREAGVDRVNVSLDTLRRDRFSTLARRPERFYDDTLAGIAAAERAGFSPIKINVVVMRGFNDDERFAHEGSSVSRVCVSTTNSRRSSGRPVTDRRRTTVSRMPRARSV